MNEIDYCKYCNLECISESILCDECNGWYHRKCAKISPKIFQKLANSNRPFLCNTCKIHKYCKICTKYCRINQKSIKCDICSHYIHLKCTPFTVNQYDRVINSNEVYYCAQCVRETLPFGDSPDTQESLPLGFDQVDNCALCIECNYECLECDTCVNIHRICNTCNNCKYHDYESMSEFLSNKPEGGLSLMHFNTRSLPKNFCSFYDVVSNLPKEPDIICISETKLSNYVQGNEPLSEQDVPKHSSEIDIEIPNFTFLCNNSETNAGGTGIYVKNALDHKDRPDLEPNFEGCEGNFVEISKGSNQRNILVASIYRHPHDNHDIFL